MAPTFLLPAGACRPAGAISGSASFRSTGVNSLHSTYVGGSGAEGIETHNLAVDGDRVYIAGQTGSPTFPNTSNASFWSGQLDGVVVALDTTARVIFSRYIGTPGADGLEGVQAGPADVCVTGFMSGHLAGVPLGCGRREGRGAGVPLPECYRGHSWDHRGRNRRRLCSQSRPNHHEHGRRRTQRLERLAPPQRRLALSRRGRWVGAEDAILGGSGRTGRWSVSRASYP